MADENKPAQQPQKAAAPKKAAKDNEPDLVMEPSRYSGMKIEDAEKAMEADAKKAEAAAKGDDAPDDEDRSQTMDPADDFRPRGQKEPAAK